jgi:hypothetical protein
MATAGREPLGLDLRAGYQFMRFSDYNLGGQNASDDITPNHSYRSDESWDYAVGFGFQFDLKNDWQWSVGYYFRYLEGYRLGQKTEVADFINNYGYEINHVNYRRLVVALGKSW